MSLSLDLIDPCAKNVSKLLKAISEYIDVNQKISIQLDIKFVKKKEGS